MKVQSSKFKVHTFAALLLCVAAAMMPAQTGGTFDLSYNVIASGGGKSTGTNGVRNFTIEGTIGQGFAGTESLSTSPQFSVRGGFWAFPAPTAATVSVSGRVLTAQGRGLAATTLTMTNSAGGRVTTMTNAFGFYRFDEVSVGQTYTVTVLTRRFQFTPHIVLVDDEITGLDFVALVNSF